jgi:hypothetical protein
MPARTGTSLRTDVSNGVRNLLFLAKVRGELTLQQESGVSVTCQAPQDYTASVVR